MFRNLRIACSIIAAIFAAGAVFVFIYAGMEWGFGCVGGALIFFGLTVLFRKLQVRKELQDNPPPPEGDFITGRVADNNNDGTEENK